MCTCAGGRGSTSSTNTTVCDMICLWETFADAGFEGQYSTHAPEGVEQWNAQFSKSVPALGLLATHLARLYGFLSACPGWD